MRFGACVTSAAESVKPWQLVRGYDFIAGILRHPTAKRLCARQHSAAAIAQAPQSSKDNVGKGCFGPVSYADSRRSVNAPAAELAHNLFCLFNLLPAAFKE